MKQIETNCPFTLVEYRKLVRMAKKRFPIVSYKDYNKYSSFVIWRHDVEYSVEEMDKLAAIDTEEGIMSVFFVNLHNEYYNFWNSIAAERIKGWIKDGHEIGLHFDFGYYGDNTEEIMEKYIEYEKVILENVFETSINSFSFHNPNSNILSYQGKYAGLVNAYNKDFFNSDIVYVSDSNGRWRQRTIRDVLEDKKTIKAQINTHDTWWTDERIPQIKKLENALIKSAYTKIENYKGFANIVVEDII